MSTNRHVAILTIVAFTVAQQLPAMSNRAQECPNFDNMITFCDSVENRSQDPENPRRYLYDTKIMNASCVLPTDTPAEMRAKVQRMWKTFEDQLICDSGSF